MGWSRLAKRIFRPVPIFAILLTIFVFKYYIIDLELFKNTNDYSNGHRVPVGHVERYKIPEHPVKTVQAVPPQPPPPPPDSRGIVPVIDTNHNRKLAANTSTRILKPPVPPPKPVIALTNQSVVKAVPKTVDSDRKRLILAWTSLTDKKPEWGIKSYTFRPCQYKNCEITSNRTSLDSADLLIFRIRQIRLNPSGKSYRPYVHHLDFTDMPARHKSGQIWMDINQVYHTLYLSFTSIHPPFPSIYLPYLSIYLPSYLPTRRSRLSTCHTCLSTLLRIYLPAVLVYLPAIPVYLPSFASNYLPFSSIYPSMLHIQIHKTNGALD